MKATLFAALAILLSIASPAFAAAGTQGHSGILVWAFIGFFALIVVAQLVPAFVILFAAVKGLFQGREASEIKVRNH
ncbi:hypothetical protein SAMN05660860_02369 [Geoalkalibacter ferrihydriticus]|uniref:Uncharacterized protein n=2 Tax=Geoalkalibacter ferrihydriticus TaxID=392333 RepID=A0A0C2HLJ7_9BACT|nr:hypothetical protein [Geoalkalibacter ferrihydriticus]KIH77971.1 hypothetical protein GFER_05030 [Geoalkalibacter ferrihydriticus DSM 17813]SDM34725.1 hypothetical protein SAMN05660860_02369 [Geoalkalibacter ferrihydriticus]